MKKENILEIVNYIIAGHTVEETALYFGKSPSSIKKYLAKFRNKDSEFYDPILVEKLSLAQAKISLERTKLGGSIGKRGKTYEEFTARMYAEAYLTGLTLEELSELSMISISSLHDMIRGIDDKELQKRIDEYILNRPVIETDKIGKQQWKR